MQNAATDTQLRGRSRRYHCGTAVLTALPLFFGVILAQPVMAQYLDPPPNDGYLDGPRVAPPPEFQAPPPEPLVRLGAGLYLGAGYTDYGDLDRAYLEPNSAKEFGDFYTFALDVAAWIQFGPAFRLGVQGGNQLAGSGATNTNYGGVGLLLEGGWPLGRGWSLWGGPVLGYQHLYAESKDDQSQWLEYAADYLQLRLQMSLEREMLPFMSLRGTLFYSFNSLVDEDFATQSRSAIIPFETDFYQHSGGLLLGILFGT